MIFLKKKKKKVKLSLREELHFISGFQLLGPPVAWFRRLFAAIRDPPVKWISGGRGGHYFMHCWFFGLNCEGEVFTIFCVSQGELDVLRVRQL